jgi:hypothetical protein
MPALVDERNLEDNRRAPGTRRLFYLEGASGVPGIAVARRGVAQRRKLFQSFAQTPQILSETPQIFLGRCRSLPRRVARAMGRLLRSPRRVRNNLETPNVPQDVANRLHDCLNASQESPLPSHDDPKPFRTHAIRPGTSRTRFRKRPPLSCTRKACIRTSRSHQGKTWSQSGNSRSHIGRT